MVLVTHGADTRVLALGESISFGRDTNNDLVLGDDDLHVSRRAGRIHHRGRVVEVSNLGSRSLRVVEPRGEFELSAEAEIVSHSVGSRFSWIRLIGERRDYAIGVVADVADPGEPPGMSAVDAPAGRETVRAPTMSLTENEHRTMVAIYRHFLVPPPRYRRQPRSFRAAARELSVTEAKCKADHRRVVAKVEQAGGPSDGHTNREALLAWLLCRGHLQFDFTSSDTTDP